VLARLKDNLNQAEDVADRRRWLFANEATNQIDGARERLDRHLHRTTGESST
jgi:hypothetical protein